MAEQRAAVDRVAVVRALTHFLPRGDWVGAFDDTAEPAQLRTYLEGVAVPDLEVEGMVAGQAGLVAPAPGVDGLVEFWRDWLEPWETFTVETREIREGPKAVLIDAVQKGRLAGSRATVETPSAAVFFFRGDRLARIEFHLDQQEAREAAGLT
jgi:hypothetical protein